MTNWHAPADSLRRYAIGTVDDVTACSIEAHLERCALCRGVIATDADPVLMEAMWDGVEDRVDHPHLRVVERALRGVGLDEGSARLVAATPGLRLAWLAAVALIVGLVVLMCASADSDALFLAVAPLLPLLGVAAVFAPGVEPAGEIGAATPLFGFGLVLRRSEAVLVASFGMLILGALALPGLELRDAGWVLPALALSLTTIALSTRLAVVPIASVLGSAWITGLGVLSYLDGRNLAVVDAAAFTVGGQIAFASAAAVAFTVIALRDDLSPIDPGV